MHGELDRSADHHRGELGVRGGGRGFADHLSEADDGDAVRDLADLAELVGDEDDGCPGCLELAHDLHQLVGLLRGEDRGGLVEDEHPGVAGERLDDLDPLLDADGELLDQRVGIDVESEPSRDLAHALAGRADVQQSARASRLVSEHDVLGHAEDGDEHEVLVHHADAGAHRVAGTLEVLHLAVEKDGSLFCRVQAVEDVHERRLACAVLAEQTVDLSGLHHEIDVVVGDETAEPLRDPAEFELHGADPSEGGAPTHRDGQGRRAGCAVGQTSGEAGMKPDLPTAAGLSPGGTTRP